ncbi:MAG: hypothetical protein ACTJHT_11945 [Sphingobacterium sp.]
MGWLEDIAECTIKGERDYVLALKNSQHSLYETVVDSIRIRKSASYDEDIDIGHGPDRNQEMYRYNRVGTYR